MPGAVGEVPAVPVVVRVTAVALHAVGGSGAWRMRSPFVQPQPAVAGEPLVARHATQRGVLLPCDIIVQLYILGEPRFGMHEPARPE